MDFILSEQGNVQCEVRNSFFHFFVQGRSNSDFLRSKSVPPSAKHVVADVNKTPPSQQTVGSVSYKHLEESIDGKEIDSVRVMNIPWVCEREDVARAINETCGYSSDLSTAYSPRSQTSFDSAPEEYLAVTPIQDPPDARSIAANVPRAQRPSQNSIASSLCQNCIAQQDEGMNACVEVVRSSQPQSKARLQKDFNMDALNSAIHAALTTRLPRQCVKIEKVVTEELFKSFVFAEVPRSSFATSQCYDIMQRAKQALTKVVSDLESAFLLSARVQKEDAGYSLRCSVACVPDSARDKLCWAVVRHGSCSKGKCCRWYHPQPTDIMKLKIIVRHQDALHAKSSKTSSNVPTAP